jgi:hypothetical protein
MNLNKLQIVSFDNPYPPNFGGVIDVFYKIKFLHQLKVEIYLHIYTDKRLDISPLEGYCKAIYIYKRNKSYHKFLSRIPFRIKSRTSTQIYDNLEQIEAPIIFEGLQSTSVLLNHKLKNKVIVRAHNIEHRYYYGLAKSTSNAFKKCLFWWEGYKFEHYENILNRVDAVLTLSRFEHNYFEEKYNVKAYYVPVFHGNETISDLTEQGNYALYHGDLSTSDNLKSAEFLIKVFAELPFSFIIASSALPKSLKVMIDRYENIQFKKLGDTSADLDTLIANAHVNVLYSNQATGTKLKVFYALYKGRYCIVNENIVDDSAILSLCEVANTKTEIINKVNEVMKKPFHLTTERKDILRSYVSIKNAENLKVVLNNILNS